MKNKRVYTKINETTFKVDELRELTDTIEVGQTLTNMAGAISKLRSYVGNVAQLKAEFENAVKWYNLWVDILAEAKEQVKLAVKVPEKFEL
jgi:hypothetical protein